MKIDYMDPSFDEKSQPARRKLDEEKPAQDIPQPPYNQRIVRENMNFDERSVRSDRSGRREEFDDRSDRGGDRSSDRGGRRDSDFSGFSNRKRSDSYSRDDQPFDEPIEMARQVRGDVAERHRDLDKRHVETRHRDIDDRNRDVDDRLGRDIDDHMGRDLDDRHHRDHRYDNYKGSREDVGAWENNNSWQQFEDRGSERGGERVG